MEEKPMKRWIPLVLSLLGLCFTTSGLAKANLIRLRLIEATHSVFYAPQYAALNLGFFTKEGLEVELTNGQGSDKVMVAVLAGQADIGFGGPEAVLYVYKEGKRDHPVVFAQVTDTDGSFLVGRQPEPDFKWINVKGKTIIGGRKGGMPEMTLEHLLRQNHLQPGKDVQINTGIQFALMAPAFLNGRGDYVALFEPTATLLERAGKGHIVASIGKDSGALSYTAYFAKKSFLARRATAIQRFTNALYRGQRWVERHSPAEIAAVIASSFPDSSSGLLAAVVRRYKDQNTWNTNPVLKKRSFQAMQRIMKEAGELDKFVPYERIVNASFAAQAVNAIQ
jgi:NitT/TauT family transport system substrate-binding protein